MSSSTTDAPSSSVHRQRHRYLSFLTLFGLLATLFVAVEGVGSDSAEASHFRSTQLTWQVVDASDPSSVEVEFTSTFAARSGYYGNPPVGGTVREPTINFGDGSSVTPGHTVINVDTANDWLIAEWHGTHTYDTTSSTTFTAYWDLCCRLGSSNGHVNNPDGNNRIESFIDLENATSGPVSSISPIVDCPTDALCQFQVPGFDAEGMELSWRFASSSEAGGGFSQPAGATINASGGQYSWATPDPSGSGPFYYSTQVIIEKSNSAGDIVASTGVDFFIRLGVSDDNAPPAFTAPTPADGTVIVGAVGQELTFDVAADDPNPDDTVTLNVFPLPPGADFDATDGNPASGTFTWTPEATGTSFVRLTAQDDLGLGATQRTVTLRIGVLADIALEPAETSLDVGDSHELQASVVDGSGEPVEGADVTFEILDGPNSGTSENFATDANGEASFSYSSDLAGLDEVIARVTDDSTGHTLESDVAIVRWLPAPGAISLEPSSTSGAIGDEHTVTATLLDDAGEPVTGAEISFEITDGPHEGSTGTSETDGDGQATFTYEGTEVGTDTIVATYTPEDGDELTSNEATMAWSEVLADAEEADDEEDDLVEVKDEAQAAEPVEAEPDFTG